MTTGIYPRFLATRLEEALDDTPVMLVRGPRQCGKTTLVRQVGQRLGFAYFTFDDPVVLAATRADPVGFVADLPPRAIIDEVQRVPELFPSIKLAVDRDRRPGRLLLTGSADVLALPALSESLAGRIEILRLHPLAQCEVASRRSGFLDQLLTGTFRAGTADRLGADLLQRLTVGGYPEAVKRTNWRRRSAWQRSYLETIVSRDVPDLARIGSLDALPRLLSLAAGQTARLLNVSNLAGPFQLSRPTIRDYLTLLGRVFLVEELAPWHTNRLSRLVKTPKLHLTDTGLAAALLGVDAETLAEDRELLGQLVETFVVQELRRLASFHPEDLRFYHFRDRDGFEVDVVIEQGGRRVTGVEVKAGSTVRAGDFRGLRKLAETSGNRFVSGVVLYDGEATVTFGDRMFAVPLAALWETP